MKRLTRRLLFLWELPQVVLGSIFLVLLGKKVSGRQFYRDISIYYIKDFPGGISLSWFIFLDSDERENSRVVKHEYGHSKQSLYLGWLYLIIAGIPSITRAVIWRLFKLEREKYYTAFPENWADRLGGVRSPH